MHQVLNYRSSLSGSFKCTDWDIFGAGADSFNKLTDIVTSYVNLYVELCIPIRTMERYSNNKPWSTKDIQVLFKKQNCFFFLSAGPDKQYSERYTIAKYELRSAIRKISSQIMP